MEGQNKSYIFGIIGGLIGGFIATIPWILVYVYCNMILSLLAIIIALGVLKGYQLLKGKVDDKLPIIIVVISCICITISTFIIIPILLMKQENIIVSMDNFKQLYDYSPFVNAIIRDYIISLIFTFLGISGVVKNVRKQIDDGVTENVKVPIINNTLNSETNEKMAKVKQVFLKLNATDKYSAVSKEQIFNYLSPMDKSMFNIVKRSGIIKKYRGNFYYSLKDEKSPFKRFLKIYFKVCLIMIIFLTLIFGLIFIL